MALGLTNTRAEYQSLGTTYLITGLCVFAIVVGILLFLLIRYRARDGDGRRPKRKHEANVLESLYVVGLIGIVAWLLTINFNTLNRENAMTTVAEHSRDTVRINVIGAQWNWRFDYPGTPPVQIVSSGRLPTVFYVPVNRPVLFRGHSQDVLHDFWIPALRFQRQVWPDHVNTWTLVFPTAGRYQGLCAWFCGLYHDNMHFVAIAVSPARFASWLARERRLSAAGGPASSQIGAAPA